MADAKVLFSHPSSYFSFEGTDIHFIDTGKGESSVNQPTVVLLHGNPTWCYLYRNLLDELGDSFRLIAIDYRGCGLSGREHKRPLRFADRVKEVVALIEHLKLSSFSLVLHDWGGPIGTGVALKLKPSVVSLTYLNTTLTEVSQLPWFIRLSRQLFVGSFLTSTTKTFLSLMTSWGVGKKLPQSIKANYHLPYQTQSDRLAIEDFVADIPFDTSHPTHAELTLMREQIAELKSKPVQIIWGLKDPCFHLGMLRSVSSLFPSAEVLELPEASHLVIEDAPAVVIPAIQTFLSKVHDYSVEGQRNNDTGKSQTFTSLIRTYAEQHPNQPLFVQPATEEHNAELQSIRYEGFVKKMNQYRRGLVQLGLRPQQRVLFLLPVGVEFLAFAFAVMESGATPVFVDPGVGLANLKKCFHDADCTALIASPKARILKTLLPKYFRNMAFEVTVPDSSQKKSATHQFLQRQLDTPLKEEVAGDVAMIAFTSGATGYPKGVIFTDEMLQHQVTLYQQELGVKPGERNMPLLPVFCLYNAAAGVTSILPKFNAYSGNSSPSERYFRNRLSHLMD
jgi:pimeloyl-ACP methyl ester carboxylesterase